MIADPEPEQAVRSLDGKHGPQRLPAPQPPQTAPRLKKPDEIADQVAEIAKKPDEIPQKEEPTPRKAGRLTSNHFAWPQPTLEVS
jgi:hypothetical protein